MPVFWISKWVDYSDKYGLGYQLCDTSVGVLFNDSTRMLLGSDEKCVCIGSEIVLWILWENISACNYY